MFFDHNKHFNLNEIFSFWKLLSNDVISFILNVLQNMILCLGCEFQYFHGVLRSLMLYMSVATDENNVLHFTVTRDNY